MKLSKLFEVICLATIAIGCAVALVACICFEEKSEYIDIANMITVSAMASLSGYATILDWNMKVQRIYWISAFVLMIIALLFLVNQVVL